MPAPGNNYMAALISYATAKREEGMTEEQIAADDRFQLLYRRWAERVGVVEPEPVAEEES
jgi:hypothetical protein